LISLIPEATYLIGLLGSIKTSVSCNSLISISGMVLVCVDERETKMEKLKNTRMRSLGIEECFPFFLIKIILILSGLGT